MNLEDFWLLRLAKCWLNKIFFGTYWIAMLSDSLLKTITSIYESTLKISLGVSKKAPSGVFMELVSEPSLVDKAAYFLTLRFYESRFTIRRRVHVFDLIKKESTYQNISSRTVRKTTRIQTLASLQIRYKWDFWKEKCEKWLGDVLDDLGCIWCYQRLRFPVDVIRSKLKDLFWPMKLHSETTFRHVRVFLNGKVRERIKK